MLENICLSKDKTAIIILDQTRLPNEEVFLELGEPEECYDAIKRLAVRGAPAIGIFAACALYVISRRWGNLSYDEFLSAILDLGSYLISSRPTAVNLSWAVQRQIQVVRSHPDSTTERIIGLLGEEAEKIQQEDKDMCFRIASFGLSLLKDGEGILTHCNAGPLATSRYGTALGPMILGKERGMNFRVYADETRPLLQGARLTAYELQKEGIDVTLICDNMASVVMKNGWVDKVFVGCDRIAANGDAANKIGTCGVAILANYYHIPFYVLGPSSTIDFDTRTGKDIPIELRDPEEIKSMWYEKKMAPEAVRCYNPAFDVTDHSLITGIITEQGIISPPFEENLRVMQERVLKKLL